MSEVWWVQVRKCNDGVRGVWVSISSRCFMIRINDIKSNLSLMTLPRHDDTTMIPAVVAMMAWMEDTSLRKRQTHENIEKGHTKWLIQDIHEHSLITLWTVTESHVKLAYLCLMSFSSASHGLERNISTTTELTAVKFRADTHDSQRMKPSAVIGSALSHTVSLRTPSLSTSMKTECGVFPQLCHESKSWGFLNGMKLDL